MWMSANLAAAATVSDLADRLGIALRTLERRFRAATGTSVRKYWQQQRITLAKELLEKTNLSVGDVGWRIGYSDGGYFARLFKREMSVAPLEYRKTVRAKLFRSESTRAETPVNKLYTPVDSGKRVFKE